MQPEIKPPGNYSVAPPAYVWEESAGLHVGGEAAHPAHNHWVRFTPVSSSEHVNSLQKILSIDLAGNYGFKEEFQSKESKTLLSTFTCVLAGRHIYRRSVGSKFLRKLVFF